MVESLPLADIRVVEFTHAVMGPTCGMFLNDLGAEIVKVEPAPGGDRTRYLKAAGAGYFAYYNRGKKSLAVDLDSEEGRAIVEKLVRRADVVIENFAPGAQDRRGLGYAALSALNPRLVYCALKGFLPGPYERRGSLDEVAQMMSGLAYMTGLPERPMRAGASVLDVMGGMAGAFAIVVALRERERTGRGSEVSAALFETAALLMGQHMAQSVATGTPLKPMSIRMSAWAVYDIFRCADGSPVFIGIVTDTQWRRFCEVFERPDLAADPELQTNARRSAARANLMPELETMIGRMNRAELLAKCEAAAIAFGPVNRPEDLFDDPHLASGGLWDAVLPEGRRARLPGLPFSIAGRRFGTAGAPPAVGEHSRAILLELGYAEPDIAALEERGIIGRELP